MPDHLDILGLANATIAFITLHSPWLEDKLASSILSESVKETWSLLRTKLGPKLAEAEVPTGAAAPSPGPDMAAIRLELLNALREDGEFARKLATHLSTTPNTQIAVGRGHNQITIAESSSVSVNIG